MGGTEIAHNLQSISLGPSLCEQHMSLCLGGIKIEKTTLEGMVCGPLLISGEPLGVAVGVEQKVEGGNSPTRVLGSPTALFVA